jgi:hypothetical protein
MNMLGKYLGINVKRTGHTSIRVIHCLSGSWCVNKPPLNVN